LWVDPAGSFMFRCPDKSSPAGRTAVSESVETRTLAELHHRSLADPEGPRPRTRQSYPCASLLHLSTLSAYSTSPFCPVPSTIWWSATVSVTGWLIKVGADIGANLEIGAVTSFGVLGLENSGEYRLAIGGGA
jgi:hypothetical protein